MESTPTVRPAAEAGGPRRRLSRRARILIGLAIVVALAPVRITCGHMFAACAAPGLRGGAVYYYEIEPLGITVVETLLGVNTRVCYYAGHTE